VNRQFETADSKYVVLDDALPTGHVTWRMRIANFAIKMGNLYFFHPLLSNGSS